ncbi:MAG TPA: hypothetical protein PK280_05130 [Planctomycetota bacterium]|nr:hypothetical protein [Planctomycetota bacterium]
MTIFDELSSPGSLNEAGQCVVHNATLLLGALVTRGIVHDEPALELAHRKLISRLGNSSLVRESITAACSAFRARAGGASPEEVMAAAREGTGFSEDGTRVVWEAVRRFPAEITRGDYACLHRRSGTPRGKDDENYLVCSLEKGLLRHMLEGQSLPDFRQTLAGKGIPTDSFDAVLATVKILLPGLRAGTDRKELLEALRGMKLDAGTAGMIFETVREFAEGLDFFASIIEGRAAGLAGLEFEEGLRAALAAAVSSINEDHLRAVACDGVSFERVNQPSLFAVVKDAQVAMWSKDHSDLTAKQFLAKRQRDAEVRGGIRGVDLAKTRLHVLWGPPHPGDNDKHSYTYVIKATIDGRAVFFEVSDIHNEETVLYWEHSSSKLEDRTAVEQAFWRLLGLAPEEASVVVPASPAPETLLEGRDAQVAGYAAVFIRNMAELGQGARWDYSEASLEHLDPEITRMWGGKPPAKVGQMAAVWGGYFGMVIRKHMKSRWLDDDPNFPSLEVTGRTTFVVNPFSAAHKRLANGDGDNLLFKYRMFKKIYEEGDD